MIPTACSKPAGAPTPSRPTSSRTLAGLIQSETADALVLAMPGGAKETLSRSAIQDMKSLDRTLMPDGLEAAISKEQMSDLIAFLLGK